MLKLPFFNLRRYVELRCYTNNHFHLEECPITLSSKLPAMRPTRKVHEHERSFSACYGYIAGMKRSAVLPAWAETEFVGVSNEEGVRFAWSDDCGGYSKIDTHNDAVYNRANASIVKMTNPWMLEETTGVDFVLARHIRNTTPMSIPSGIVPFKDVHVLNVFNIIEHNQPKYRIPFNMPLIALYPMSDLPLHVECIYDEADYKRLQSKTNSNAYFRGNYLKFIKNKS